LYLLYLSVLFVKADTISCNFTGLQVHYGFIIPHSKSIEAISHTNPFGIQLSFNKLHYSYDKWKVFNTYWISGIEARYFNYQNPTVLGGVFDASLFAEPVLLHRDKFLITIRGGAGICYHTKIYDPVENPLNLFFSSRFSFPLYIDLRLKYRISNRTLLTLSGCYNHISNGGVKQPNKGMNFPTMALGIEQFHTGFPPLNHNYYAGDKAIDTDYFIVFQPSVSVKVQSKEEGFPEKACMIYGFHSRIVKPLGKFYALNTGAELLFDGYVRESIHRDSLNYDYKRFSLTFGQDFMFGKVIFTQYFGVYLYSPYKARNAIYQKYELAYRFNNYLSMAVYLKAHLHVGDLLGINANFNIFRKEKSKL